MNCERSRSLILLRGSGDTTSREHRRLEGHLARCADCRDYADNLTPLPLASLGADLPLGDQDFAEIRQRVMNRVSAVPQTGSISWFPRLAAVGSAIVLLILVAVFAFRPGQDVQTTPASEDLIAERSPAPEPVDKEEHHEISTVPPRMEPMEHTRREDVRPEPIAIAAGRSQADSRSLDETGESAAVNTSAETSAEIAPVRLELQTSDPTIRIIWIASNSTGPSNDMDDTKISNRAQEAS